MSVHLITYKTKPRGYEYYVHIDAEDKTAARAKAVVWIEQSLLPGDYDILRCEKLPL